MFPVHKCEIFVRIKATQGYPAWRTLCTPQSKTRGERRPGQKGPFMDGN